MNAPDVLAAALRFLFAGRAGTDSVFVIALMTLLIINIIKPGYIPSHKLQDTELSLLNNRKLKNVRITKV